MADLLRPLPQAFSELHRPQTDLAWSRRHRALTFLVPGASESRYVPRGKAAGRATTNRGGGLALSNASHRVEVRNNLRDPKDAGNDRIFDKE